MMGWAYISVDRDLESCIFYYGHLTDTTFYYIGTTTNGLTLQLYNGSSAVSGSSIGLNTWKHIAMTVSGTGTGNFLGYIDGVLNATHDGNSSVLSQQIQMADSTQGDAFNGRLAAIKVYSAVLTEKEIQQEMQQFFPVRTLNLNTWLPCVDPLNTNNALDMSGNGFNMSIDGPLSVEDGPPIPWRIGRKKYFIPLAVGAVSLEQEGFRWRNDDGSETTATWKGAQDADITNPTGQNMRLRILVNATGDPTSKDFLLEGKKSTDTDWAKI